MAQQIVKITFQGCFGWGMVEQSFHDKLTITPDEVTYKYKSDCPSKKNPSRKWHYFIKTDEETALYARLVENYDIVKALPEGFIYDMCPTVVKFFFDDGHYEKVATYCLNEAKEFLLTALMFIPQGCEMFSDFEQYIIRERSKEEDKRRQKLERIRRRLIARTKKSLCS